jgi:putative membrane protein
MYEFLAQHGRMMGPGGERVFEFGAHHYWLGPVAMLLIFAMLVAGAIIIVRLLTNRPHQGTPSRGPLQILEERFAKGEIDEEEFRTRREALRS